jgi:hypothetical protein
VRKCLNTRQRYIVFAKQAQKHGKKYRRGAKTVGLGQGKHVKKGYPYPAIEKGKEKMESINKYCLQFERHPLITTAAGIPSDMFNSFQDSTTPDNGRRNGLSLLS